MEVFLPFEKLNVYRVSLDLVEHVLRVSQKLPAPVAHMADELRRASTSVTLNIAEGSGEFSAREKTRFYRMALRSAVECAAGFDILRRAGAIEPADHDLGRQMAARVLAMLIVLCRRQGSMETTLP